MSRYNKNQEKDSILLNKITPNVAEALTNQAEQSVAKLTNTSQKVIKLIQDGEEKDQNKILETLFFYQTAGGYLANMDGFNSSDDKLPTYFNKFYQKWHSTIQLVGEKFTANNFILHLKLTKFKYLNKSTFPLESLLKFDKAEMIANNINSENHDAIFKYAAQLFHNKRFIKASPEFKASETILHGLVKYYVKMDTSRVIGIFKNEQTLPILVSFLQDHVLSEKVTANLLKKLLDNLSPHNQFFIAQVILTYPHLYQCNGMTLEFVNQLMNLSGFTSQQQTIYHARIDQYLLNNESVNYSNAAINELPLPQPAIDSFVIPTLPGLNELPLPPIEDLPPLPNYLPSVNDLPPAPISEASMTSAPPVAPPPPPALPIERSAVVSSMKMDHLPKTQPNKDISQSAGNDPRSDLLNAIRNGKPQLNDSSKRQLAEQKPLSEDSGNALETLKKALAGKFANINQNDEDEDEDNFDDWDSDTNNKNLSKPVFINKTASASTSQEVIIAAPNETQPSNCNNNAGSTITILEKTDDVKSISETKKDDVHTESASSFTKPLAQEPAPGEKHLKLKQTQPKQEPQENEFQKRARLMQERRASSQQLTSPSPKN